MALDEAAQIEVSLLELLAESDPRAEPSVESEGGASIARPTSSDRKAPRSTTVLRERLGARGTDLAAWFDELALALLGHYQLEAGGQAFRLLELEFYFHAAGHADPTVHRNERQLATCAHWYFHREKAARLGFTRKGLDLTFGRPGAEYGGILIRAVQPEGKAGARQVVEGPSRVVDVILRAAGVESVLEFYARPGFTCDALAAGPLRLVPSPIPLKGTVHIGPRVGLRSAPFSEAPYRYRVAANIAAKDRRGLLAGRQLELG
jgi:hypothetical protein